MLHLTSTNRLHRMLLSNRKDPLGSKKRCLVAVVLRYHIIQSKVYFIHQTVKEFLLGKLGTKRPAGRVWQQSLELEESHHLLAKICLRSISFSEIELHRASLCNALLPEDSGEISNQGTYCQSHTFLSYSAIYWADHFKIQRSNEGIQTIEYILEKSSDHQVIDRWNTDHGTILHAASLGGHDLIVQMLLKKGVDVNAQGGELWQRTAGGVIGRS